MIRFDYEEQTNGDFNVTIVSEKGDIHKLCGRIVLDSEEWKELWSACAFSDIPETLDSIRKPKFFKFENKKQGGLHG